MMDSPSSINTKSYLDFDGLGQLKGQAHQNSGAALKETAQQFEAMFLQEMLKSMRQTVDKSELTSSSATETFENMFDKEVAFKMAQKGGTGLASMLVAHLEKQKADAAHTAEIMQSQGLQNTGKPIALDPQPQGLPLVSPAAPAGLPLKNSNALPINLPPKPLGSD
jgi:peptidoglycan hydrolase FlgJ